MLGRKKLEFTVYAYSVYELHRASAGVILGVLSAALPCCTPPSVIHGLVDCSHEPIALHSHMAVFCGEDAFHVEGAMSQVHPIRLFTPWFGCGLFNGGSF